VTVPAPTRAAPGKREAALGVTAAVVVLLPLLVAGAVGHQVEQVAPGGTDLGGLDVLRHNLRLGLAIGVLGWLTLGVGAAGVAAGGPVASGYVLGAHVADLGRAAPPAPAPPRRPELLAFVAFTGAGLHGAVWVWSYVRGAAPARALTRAVLAATAWTAAGTVLLVAAAALESTVI